MESSLPPPPFLTKTYDMVDDSATDAIVAWSPTCRNSFVVWDFYEFSRSLLPRFFKHSNFSSFVRQLNTYGFRKSDPDRWEFSHEEFVRDERHRLKNIHRKKPAGSSSSNPSASHPQPYLHAFAHTGLPPSHTAWPGVGYEQAAKQTESEVEQLRRERSVMMLELNRLGGQHHSAHQQIKCIHDRLQAMEMRQQQIVSFVSRTMCAPKFLYQYVNQAIAADRSLGQQKLLEDSLEDSNSSGSRKRRRITYTDRCAIESGVIAEYNQLQLQYAAEEHASSCEINQETTTSITNTSDDQESAASHDCKVLGQQLNLENDSNATACLDSVQGGGNAARYLAYQSRASCRHHKQDVGVAPTTCSGMSEDGKMNMIQLKSEGYELTSETEDHLRMVDLNLQPLNMADDLLSFLPSSREESGDGLPLMKCNSQVNASNTFYDDLESELFWEHLLWPVTIQ